MQEIVFSLISVLILHLTYNEIVNSKNYTF